MQKSVLFRLIHKDNKNHSSPLHRIRHINGLRTARLVMGLSQSEIASRIAKRIGAGHIAQSIISKWETPKKYPAFVMPDEAINAVCQELSNWLYSQLGRENVGATIQHNSPWRVIVKIQCSCGRLTELKRASQTSKCQRCNKR